MRVFHPLWFLVIGGLAAMLTACASGGKPPPATPPPAPGAPLDASYDWHGLMIARFGTLLKDSPVPLHEVLLFRDDTHSAAETEGRDCHAVDSAPPRFVDQQPDQYLLCFDHDRLNRIEASVRLASEDAGALFARACALWLKNTVPDAGAGTVCEGRDGAVAFSARLQPVPGERTVPLSITLTAAGSNEAPATAPAAPRDP